MREGYVLMGEVSIVDGRQGSHSLWSNGASSCCIIAAYCPETKKTLMGHMPIDFEPDELLAQIRSLRESPEQQLQVCMASGCDSGGIDFDVWYTFSQRLEK